MKRLRSIASLFKWRLFEIPAPLAAFASTQALLRELCDWAGQFMRAGAPLARRVPGRLGWELRLVVQGVGTRFDSYFDRPWRADEARQSRLVLIGSELNAAVLQAELSAALSTPVAA